MIKEKGIGAAPRAMFAATLAAIVLMGLYESCSCKSVEPPRPVVTVSKSLGCEDYKKRAREARALRERGELSRLYDRCRARVVELAGKYDASDVRRVALKKERDGDYLNIEQTFCLFAGKERLPKCFIIPERRPSPTAWSLFLRDASRAGGGLIVGFLAGRYGLLLRLLLPVF